MLEFFMVPGAFFSTSLFIILLIVFSVIAIPVITVILYKIFWKRRILLKDANRRIIRDNLPGVHTAYLQGLPYGTYYFEYYNGNRLSEVIPYNYTEEMQQTYLKIYR